MIIEKSTTHLNKPVTSVQLRNDTFNDDRVLNVRILIFVCEEQMNCTNDILWKVIKPPCEKNDLWLKELQAMRGEALYQDGLRPFFKLADNTFNDADEFDSMSYHILAKYNDQIVGCIRLLILDNTFNCVSAKIVNQQPATSNQQPATSNQQISFSFLINELFPNKKLIEVSRLVVRRGFKSATLHRLLMAAASLLTLKFGGQMIGNAGAKKTLYFVETAGFRLFSKFAGPYRSDTYNDDEIYLFFFEKKNIPKKFLSEINQMENILWLNKFRRYCNEQIKDSCSGMAIFVRK